MKGLHHRLQRLAEDVRPVVVMPTDTDRTLAVVETVEPGEAEVVFCVPPDRHGLNFRFHGPKWFQALSSSKTPDGFLLIEDAVGWIAVVVECKASLGGNLDKALRQLRGGIDRLQMTASLLELSVTRWKAIIATREDKTSEPSGVNTSTNRTVIDESGDYGAFRNWRDRTLRGTSVGDVHLEPVILDANGKAWGVSP